MTPCLLKCPQPADFWAYLYANHTQAHSIHTHVCTCIYTQVYVTPRVKHGRFIHKAIQRHVHSDRRLLGAIVETAQVMGRYKHVARHRRERAAAEEGLHVAATGWRLVGTSRLKTCLFCMRQHTCHLYLYVTSWPLLLLSHNTEYFWLSHLYLIKAACMCNPRVAIWSVTYVH